MKQTNNINLTIKNIVTKNLNEKREEILRESFRDLYYSENLENIQNHALVAINLINEGYSVNEITNYIDKASSTMGDLNSQYGDMFKDSMKSMAREFVIKWILEYIGFGATTSTYLAQGFADLTYKDLLLPFKNKEYCIKHLPNVLDSILEVIVRQAGHKLTGAITGRNKEDAMQKKWADASEEKMKKYKEDLKKYKRGEIDTEPVEPEEFKPKYSKGEYNWGDLLGIGIGNIAGEFIRKTETSEKIADVICKTVHK
jgi:hypothetical protein